MEASKFILSPEAEEVQTNALTIPDQAKAIAVTDADSYIRAGELWNDIRAMRKKVADTFDPMIAHWHTGHKLALKKKSEIDGPLETAEKFTKRQMNTYDEEQERIRQDEQRRLQEEAKKREEEARLQAAIEAEQAGAKEEAEEIFNEPAYVAPVIVPKAVPKVVGGPVFQTRWSHEVTDLMALVKAVAEGLAPIQAIQANDVFLGQQARSLKDAMRIPGVKSYSKRV
jgi:hypothetical protein